MSNFEAASSKNLSSLNLIFLGKENIEGKKVKFCQKCGFKKSKMSKYFGRKI